MNILISGGLGYVGGRLSKYFADQGHTVYALSRKQKVDYPNIKVFSNQAVIENGELNHLSFDVFIHLAATNEIECSEDPEYSNEVNINGTLKWLAWCKQQKVRQFIYFSTVHVYARPLVGYFDEHSTCEPGHPYSISHKAAEDYVLWYKRDFGLNTKIVRLSNSFGYPAFPTANRWTLLINDLCQQIVKFKSFEIRSNIEQHRDFISLKEVCLRLEALIQTDIPKSDRVIFNLSRGKSQSLKEITKIVQSVGEDLFKEAIPMIYDESKSNPAQSVTIDNQKLSQLKVAEQIGIKDIEEEIRQTFMYFLNNS